MHSINNGKIHTKMKKNSVKMLDFQMEKTYTNEVCRIGGLVCFQNFARRTRLLA